MRHSSAGNGECGDEIGAGDGIDRRRCGRIGASAGWNIAVYSRDLNLPASSSPHRICCSIFFPETLDPASTWLQHFLQRKEELQS
jgi:hypothetical protein